MASWTELEHYSRKISTVGVKSVVFNEDNITIELSDGNKVDIVHVGDTEATPSGFRIREFGPGPIWYKEFGSPVVASE